ncbi:MAG: hypothetical protein OZ921_14545 [Sorangiineae bacterium]|nr:hypothetical protein [Polyangiaceae bacterium]MEB2323727.1 hypothetical protein [Sorangiineae bacterium]
MRSRFDLGAWLFPLGAWAAVLAGCASTEPPLVERARDAAAETGAGGREAGASDAAPRDASSELESDAPPPDAASSPVRVGVLPGARVADDAGVTPANELAGVLDVIALGSRAVTVERRWRELFDASLAPREDEWRRLTATGRLLAESQRKLVFSLALVDGALDARPDGLGSWGSVETRAAAERLIDRALTSFGAELAYLELGSELDRSLRLASPGERAELIALFAHLVEYARAAPALPPGVAVGVGATLDGLVADSPPGLVALARRGDVAMASYFPMGQDFSARAPGTASSDLSALSAALRGADAAPFPIVLARVGYPSAGAAAGSEERQRAFLDDLFKTLALRRADYPVVVVDALDDAPPALCAERALALGAAPGDEAAEAFACSLGLRRADGSARPALASVIGGLASFMSP